MRFRLLPWEYGIRNLFRRPFRSALTLSGLALVVLLVFVVVGFIRGLEASLETSADRQVVIVHSLGASENIENSSVAARTPNVLTASLAGIQRRLGLSGAQVSYASPELYLGTNVVVGDDGQASMGIVRGVMPAALLVRRKVQLLEGRWPTSGEVLVGRLAATKLGHAEQDLAVGRRIMFEGRLWTICGMFAAGGSALESELWCPLDDLQQAMKRQDLSMVAISLAPGAASADVDEFCKEQLTLELQATPEAEYYESLRKHYGPVRMLAWIMVILIAGGGVFAGLNAMYGSVTARTRELATLQALGFSRRAIVVGLVQEAVLLAVAASLLAAAVALATMNDMAMRFTMGAFVMRVDSIAVLIGCGTGVILGAIGAIPPAIRALRLPVVEGLKAV